MPSPNMAAGAVSLRGEDGRRGERRSSRVAELAWLGEGSVRGPPPPPQGPTTGTPPPPDLLPHGEPPPPLPTPFPSSPPPSPATRNPLSALPPPPPPPQFWGVSPSLVREVPLGGRGADLGWGYPRPGSWVVVGVALPAARWPPPHLPGILLHLHFILIVIFPTLPLYTLPQEWTSKTIGSGRVVLLLLLLLPTP